MLSRRMDVDTVGFRGLGVGRYAFTSKLIKQVIGTTCISPYYVRHSHCKRLLTLLAMPDSLPYAPLQADA